MASCHYTRYVPQEKTILWENKIKVNDNKGASGEAESIIKQQPNSKVGFNFLRPSLAIFSWGNGTDSSFFGKLGEAPVVFDSVKAATGADQLSDYYFNKGFFNAKTSYKIEKKGKKKSIVKYFVTTGPQYFIDTITYEIATEHQNALKNYFNKESVLFNDMAYDADLLDKERDRLTQVFRNHGYYDFQKSYINYTADTVTAGKRLVNVKMIIPKKPVKTGDSLSYVPFEQYRMSEVRIIPDHDYRNNTAKADSLEYRGYLIKYDSLRYKPRYLTDAIHFKKGSIYNQRDIRDTYSHLSSYQAFETNEIVFRQGPRDTSGPTLIAEIRLNPQKKRTFTTELEITTISTQPNFSPGVNASISVTNRNVFGAGESLQIRFLTGYEAQPVLASDRFTYALELGTEVNLKFPRFLLPFNTVGLLPKRMRPNSQVSLYGNYLNRAEFERATVGARLGYSWKESDVKSHEVTFWNLSYSRLSNVDTAFRNSLNEIQDQAFSSEFISSFIYSFTYDERLGDLRQRNFSYFKSGFELAGTFQNVIAKNTTLGETPSDGGITTIFDVPYYQFFKPDADFRYYWNFYNNTQWVNRVYMGYIFPYGNSESNGFRVPPFSRFFFLGGTTDLRAWPAYRAGGGISTVTDYENSSNSGYSIGTLKFLFNSEYRFPIISSLHGAFFTDIGNVWLTGGFDEAIPEASLGSAHFINELYIGSGVGMRLDLDFFVIRFDVGVKVRDPGYLDQNNGWVINKINFGQNVTYNVALGYPF